MENDGVVYRDERYTLGKKDGVPYLTVNGRTYRLSCHPYEPCLYLTDETGALTAVHNAFDPADVLVFAQIGKIFTSVTGREYDARDFCEMAAYAAGKGNVGIEIAEAVFGGRPKKKTAPDGRPAGKPPEGEAVFICPEDVCVIEEDLFYGVAADYPGSVIDFCLIQTGHPYEGIDSHWDALLRAALRITAGDGELRFAPGEITAKLIPPDGLFAPASGTGEALNYRRAFLYPPHPCGHTDADFERLNDALFPRGRDRLEAFKWSTEWSDYFEEGREWWGTLCVTVYDGAMDRFAVIMASATD